MKKILLSLGFVAGTLAASAQPLLVEDFDAMTVGNLATDLTGATPGQNLWGIYSAGTGVSAADIAVVNVASGNNALSITGPAGPTASPSVTRYAFKDFSVDWTARDAGNDVVFTQFKFNTGASGVTSKNSFYGVIFDATGAPVAGYLFSPETKALTGLAFYDATSQGGQNNFYSFNLGTSNAVITLTANQEVTVDLVWDKSTGDVYWAGSNYFSYVPGSKAGVELQEFDFYATAGSGNASAATVVFDDLYIDARPCPWSTMREDAGFNFDENLCQLNATATATVNDAAVTGTFTSTTGLTFTSDSLGIIDVAGSTAGNYVVTYTTDGEVDCPNTSTDTLNIVAAVTPAFTPIADFCSGTTAPALPATSTNNIAGTWAPATISNTASGSYTFTPAQGECANGGSLAVTVKQTPAAPSISANGATAACAGAPVTLTATATGTVNWSNAATGTTTTVSAAGSYTATQTENNCTSAASTAVVLADCSGIEELANGVAIFPNPAHDVINVTVNNVNGTITLMTAEGKVVEARTVSTSTTEVFNVSDLNAGVYFFVVNNAGSVSTEKVIIK